LIVSFLKKVKFYPKLQNNFERIELNSFTPQNNKDIRLEKL